jgi:uncharacterized protein YwgA
MDRMSKLFASLQVLGVDPKMTTFADRKRIQKLVYLLDVVFGLNLGFSYNWYLHGPYSPEVTKTVFDVIEGRQIVFSDPKVLSNEELEKIDKLRLFLGSDLDSNDKLELLVSLAFLMRYVGSFKCSESDIIGFLKAKKPYFTDKEISDAINRLRMVSSY